MNKKVTFGTRPERDAAAADAWVNGHTSVETTAPPPAKDKEQTKRLTLDVSADLHRRIKVQCAERGMNIADALRGLLEQQFPAQEQH